MSEALGRLISGWLRSADDPYVAMEEISDQLKGIGGATSVGFGSNRISSLPDAVAKVLIKELELSTNIENSELKLLEFDDTSEKKEDKPTSSLKNASVCPTCGNMTLIETEGCVKCLGCGYSRC